MTEPVQAWHFMPADRKLRYGDGREVKPGVKLVVDCEPVLCQSGLHGSLRAIDALSYAQGNVVSRTEHSGVIAMGNDKLVSTERTHIWMADAEQTLRAFTRWCALDVAHLWDMPQIVRDFLETGDESLRAAARAAALDRYNDKLTTMLCELGQNNP